MSSKERPRIAIIGGGFGGICAAAQIEKRFTKNKPVYTIFEENQDFGGTWLVNKYPGCACDIPSHLYSLSFELNPYWTQNHAGQSEILAYVQQIAQKYGLYQRARFSTSVQSLEWCQIENLWKLEILDKKTGHLENLSFKFVITAVGTLRVPIIPQQFSGFTGKLIHSAEWDDSLDLTNKKVGVVGSGASAIQIIPAIAPLVQELHSYQRRPAWIMPKSQFNIPKFFQTLFFVIPFIMWLFRSRLFIFSDLRFTAFQDGSIGNVIGTFLAKRHMKKQLKGDKTLLDKLVPKYKLGCKRVVVSSNYFPTFRRPKVHLHCGEISKIQGNKVISADGTSQELDILVLATGFRVHDFFSPLKIRAKDGTDLLSKWMSEGPRTYYGIVTTEAPNLFLIRGPNTALAHNSALFMLECQVDFSLQVIKQAEIRGAKSVVIKKEAEDEWMAEISRDLKTGIWHTESCGGWYKDSRGRVTTLWPKHASTYWWETRSLTWSQFQWNH